MLARIAVPTSLVWGRDDAIVPVSVGAGRRRAVRLAAAVLDNTGNEPAIEDPEAFVEGGDVMTDLRHLLTPDEPGYPEATAAVERHGRQAARPGGPAGPAAEVVERRPATRGSTACRCRCAAAATTSPARPSPTVG